VVDVEGVGVGAVVAEDDRLGVGEAGADLFGEGSGDGTGLEDTVPLAVALALGLTAAIGDPGAAVGLGLADVPALLVDVPALAAAELPPLLTVNEVRWICVTAAAWTAVPLVVQGFVVAWPGPPGLVTKNMLSRLEDTTESPATKLTAWVLLRRVFMARFSPA
jgi:hypothetical protein